MGRGVLLRENEQNNPIDLQIVRDLSHIYRTKYHRVLSVDTSDLKQGVTT